MPSAPSPLQGAAAAPNSIPTFYKSIYTSARTILGDDNPLPKANQAKAEFIGAVCAYVWGLPIQQFWETQGRYINNAVSGGSEINTFFTASNINVSDTVVSPNTQVLYANAFIDLSNKILKVNYPTPDSGTYTLVQVIDPYTNVNTAMALPGAKHLIKKHRLKFFTGLERTKTSARKQGNTTTPLQSPTHRRGSLDASKLIPIKTQAKRPLRLLTKPPIQIPVFHLKQAQGSTIFSALIQFTPTNKQKGYQHQASPNRPIQQKHISHSYQTRSTATAPTSTTPVSLMVS